MISRFIKPLGIAAFAVAMALPGIASAADDVTTVVVSSGGLSISALTVDDFAITLGATGGTDDAAVVFTASDFTGTGDGWSVQVAATQFTGTGNTLAVGSLDLAVGVVTPVGTTSTAPSPAAAADVDSVAAATVQTIATAALGDGMGEYDFAINATVSVPADVVADSYTSTVTVSIVATP